MIHSSSFELKGWESMVRQSDFSNPIKMASLQTSVALRKTGCGEEAAVVSDHISDPQKSPSRPQSSRFSMCAENMMLGPPRAANYTGAISLLETRQKCGHGAREVKTRFEIVYGCMSRTPCVHETLPRRLLVLYDELRPCGISPARHIRVHYPSPMIRGMHRKTFTLLTLMRALYDATFYVKVDTDVDMRRLLEYEQSLVSDTRNARQTCYYGPCVVDFPLYLRSSSRRKEIKYVLGGVYALGRQSIDVLVRHYITVSTAWHQLFCTPKGGRRKRDEDAMVGGILYLQNIFPTCSHPVMPHGCSKRRNRRATTCSHLTHDLDLNLQ